MPEGKYGHVFILVASALKEIIQFTVHCHVVAFFLKKNICTSKKKYQVFQLLSLDKEQLCFEMIVVIFYFQTYSSGVEEICGFLFLLNKTAMHSKLCSYPQT